jgi:hypothetical protein
VRVDTPGTYDRGLGVRPPVRRATRRGPSPSRAGLRTWQLAWPLRCAPEAGNPAPSNRHRLAIRLHDPSPYMANAPSRNATHVALGPRLGDAAERTIVDAGVARQPTLIGVPVPAGRLGGRARGADIAPPHGDEPTILDTPGGNTWEPAPEGDDIDAPPFAQALPTERYVVRAGLVVRERKPRGRPALWSLLVLAMACAVGYPFRDRLRQRIPAPLADACLRMVAAASAMLDATPVAPATPTSSAETPPIAAAPAISAVPSTAPTLPAPVPKPTALSASRPPRHAPTAVSANVSTSAARASSRALTKPQPAPRADPSDNPY